MFSTSSPANLRVVGAAGHTSDTLRDEIARGAKLVIYSYNISLLVVSFKRPSNIHLVRAGESRVLKSLPFTLVSLVFGWWGLPWGIIYTFQSLATNLGGGTDITDAFLASLTPAPAEAAPGTTTAIPPPSPPPGKSARGVLAAAGLVAGIVGLIYLGLCFYHGTRFPVAIVAGTEAPYPVEINGVQHRVGPASPVRLTLSQGEIVVRGAPGQKGDLRFIASTPFFSRPFEPHVLVINPDQAALVYRETARYRTNISPTAKPEPPEYSLLANEAFHFVPEPDYFFEDFPDKISMPKGASVTPKTRMHAFAGVPLAARLPLIKDKLGPRAVHAHLTNEARLSPKSEELQRLLFTEMKPEDARVILESHLADRPVLEDWHRSYQYLMDRSFPTVDLTPRYLQWMEAEPDNGSLIYLYARTLHDRSQSEPLNEKAARARIPSSYAVYALATTAFSDGDYERALTLLDQAEKAGLKSESLQMRKRDSFFALGQIDAVLAETRRRRAVDPADLTLFTDELMLAQAKAPDAAAGQRTIAAFVTDLRRKPQAGADIDLVEPYLTSRLAYSLGKEQDSGASSAKLQSPWYAFEAAIAQRDHASAQRVIKDLPQFGARLQWILMLTAHVAGDEAASEKYYYAALAQLEKEDRYGREIRNLVQSPSAESVRKILQTPNFAAELRVLFTALGVRFPEHRALYFKRASELDHDPAFPHLLLTVVRQKLSPQ